MFLMPNDSFCDQVHIIDVRKHKRGPYVSINNQIGYSWKVSVLIIAKINGEDKLLRGCRKGGCRVDRRVVKQIAFEVVWAFVLRRG